MVGSKNLNGRTIAGEIEEGSIRFEFILQFLEEKLERFGIAGSQDLAKARVSGEIGKTGAKIIGLRFLESGKGGVGDLDGLAGLALELADEVAINDPEEK